MKAFFAALIVVSALAGQGAAQTPSREDMMKPAPNPAWNALSLKGG